MGNILDKIKNLKVKDVMDETFVIGNEDNTLREMARDITSLNASESIIIGKNGEVLGIVTLRDIVNAIGKGVSPEENISAIMTRDVIVCYEDDLLEDAILKMAKHNISRLPVLNHKNEIIGILGEKRLLRIIPALYDLISEIAHMEGGEEKEKEVEKEGICENCESYSEELINRDGKWICRACYEDIFG